MSRAPRPSFVTVPARPGEPPQALDFLAARFPRIERETWRRRLLAGGVRTADGTAVGSETPLAPGLRLAYFREVSAEPAVPFAEEALLETDDFLVVDKPPFLPVVPAGPYVNECLLFRLQCATGLGELAPAHRLDRETSGVVLFTKRRATRGLYQRLFESGEIEREYLALGAVAERPGRDEWQVENRLAPGEPWFRMREEPGPPNAKTRISLLDWQDGRGHFRLHPATGKKHQLRLHLAGLGFPILGDRYYPCLAPEAPPDFTRPLQLLAHRLAFRDPVSGQRIAVGSRRHLAW